MLLPACTKHCLLIIAVYQKMLLYYVWAYNAFWFFIFYYVTFWKTQHISGLKKTDVSVYSLRTYKALKWRLSPLILHRSSWSYHRSECCACGEYLTALFAAILKRRVQLFKFPLIHDQKQNSPYWLGRCLLYHCSTSSCGSENQSEK